MSVRCLVPHPAVGQKEAGDRAKSWLGKNKKGGAIKLRTTYYSYRNSVQHRATVNMNPTNPSTGEILINNTPQIADTVAPSQQHHPLLLLRTRMEAPHSTTAAQQNRGCRHVRKEEAYFLVECQTSPMTQTNIFVQERRCRGETVSCHQLSQDRSQGEDLKREQDPSSS